MRVLVLSHMFPNAMEPNAGIFVLEQLRALRDLGVESVVVSPVPWAPPILRSLPRFRKYSVIPERASVLEFRVVYPRTVQLPKGKLFYLYGFFHYLQCLGSVRKLARESRIDLIHAHTIMPDGFAAILLAGTFGLPVVCTVHGSDVNIYPRLNRATLVATRWALKSADFVVAVSHDLRRKIIALAGDRQVEVVHNGADPRTFKLSQKEDARARLGLPQDKKIILFVGNLVPVKGLECLFCAIQRLPRKDFCLCVVGDGNSKLALQSLATHLRIRELCRFVGSRPHDEIPYWLSAADCLALTSVNEGLGTILIEAMLCQVPVVATTVGGIPDLVIPGHTGTLVPPEDPDALAKALGAVLDRDEHISAMVRQAQIRAQASFTWESNAHKMLAVYEYQLNRGRKSARIESPTENSIP
jgi:teichuronic acid biosynthesis glycosyltransferase TuaC